MRQSVTRMVVLGIVGAMLLSGCGGTMTPVSVAPVSRVNLLVAAEGNIQLKREGWKDYVPVGFGTMLSPTDLLKVEGSVSVLCADLSIGSLDALGRVPCPADQGWLEYYGFRFDSLQRSIPLEVPYILYPRNTLVLDERPLLHWHATGAVSYTVALLKDGQVVWSQADVVSDTLRYPADAPSLRPGTDYLLIVQDNTTGRVSTEDPAKGLGFQLLDEADRRTVAQRRAEILGLASLDEPARQMALAMYYLGLEWEGERRLWGEAWWLLKAVAQTEDAPAVYLRLGDALAAMKLPGEAEAAYGKSLQRAEPLGDLETQAVAHCALWRLGDDAAHFDQAVVLYEALGDEAKADELRQEEGVP